jgi:hypothetical protein
MKGPRSKLFDRSKATDKFIQSCNFIWIFLYYRVIFSYGNNMDSIANGDSLEAFDKQRFVVPACRFLPILG